MTEKLIQVIDLWLTIAERNLRQRHFTNAVLHAVLCRTGSSWPWKVWQVMRYLVAGRHLLHSSVRLSAVLQQSRLSHFTGNENKNQDWSIWLPITWVDKRHDWRKGTYKRNALRWPKETTDHRRGHEEHLDCSIHKRSANAVAHKSHPQGGRAAVAWSSRGNEQVSVTHLVV